MLSRTQPSRSPRCFRCTYLQFLWYLGLVVQKYLLDRKIDSLLFSRCQFFFLEDQSRWQKDPELPIFRKPTIIQRNLIIKLTLNNILKNFPQYFLKPIPRHPPHFLLLHKPQRKSHRLIIQQQPHNISLTLLRTLLLLNLLQLNCKITPVQHTQPLCILLR